MKSTPIRIRIPVETLTRLQKLAVETGFSLSDLVRACVDRALPYVEDVARRSKKV